MNTTQYIDAIINSLNGVDEQTRRKIVPEFFSNLGIDIGFEIIRRARGNQSPVTRRTPSPVRAILRKNGTTTSAVTSECNGLVVKIDLTGKTPVKIVSVPPLAPVWTTEINVDKYNIYRINDGTTITLYNNGTIDHPDWRISTARGLDVTNTKSYRNSTFMDMFLDACKNDPNCTFDVNKLDPNYCYTVGFRHPKMHIFEAGSAYAVWFIQGCNVSQLNEDIKQAPNVTTEILDVVDAFLRNNYASIFNASIALREENSAPQTVLNIDSFALYQKHVIETFDIGIPFQNRVETPLTMHDMRIRNEAALDLYLNSKAVVDKAIADGSEKVSSVVVRYGYVLRPKGCYDVTRSSSVVILESTLYRYIRTLLYNLPKNYNKLRRTEHFNQDIYISLYWYLDPKMSDIFIKLFPQFRPQYAQYRILIDNIAMEIQNLHIDSNATVSEYAKRVFTQFKAKCGTPISPKDPNLIKLIKDYLLTPTRTIDYLRVIRESISQ